MAITITDKRMNDTDDYVVVTLSNGETIAIATAWATEIDPDSGKSLLALEIEQAPIRAQARLDSAAAVTAAAQAVLNSL